MDDSDFINLYFSSFNGIGLRTVEIERSKYQEKDLFKVFNKKYPEISQSDYIQWKEKFIQKIQNEGIKIISNKNTFYPVSLSNVNNPPKYLFCKGNLELLNKKTFAIVGSRNATSYGVKNTIEFCKVLSDSEFVIISGMAMGIDGIAHENALQNGTIAILGGGFDYIYPLINLKLYNDILENNGLVITEYLPDVKPIKGYFPQRSRIIAGLCSGLLVTEAREKSGSLIAANLAFEYGKNIYAIPGDINRSNSEGCNLLIMKNIAKLVRNPSDILEDYIISKTTSSLSSPSIEGYEEIVKILKDGITDIDSLIQNFSQGNSEILIKITEMEMNGIIERVGSEIYLKV